MGKKLYELTNSQKSIWYTENFFKNTNINNICTSGIIYEDINIEDLKKAIYFLVQYYDSFRIKLSLKNDVPMQYISDFVPFDIETIYVKSIEDFNNIEQKMVNEKFNIINSFLFKFKIAIFPDNSAGVILNIHHIIADSWSLGLTIQQIIKIYHCIKKGETFLTKGSSYIDYIKKEQEYKQSHKYVEDKSYWDKMFDSMPEIATIPSIENNIQTLSPFNANRLIFNIDKELLNKATIFCKENHLSFFNFFISIYAIYINRVSNIDDFVIGSPILNRTSLNDKLSTGMFVNTMPIRFNFKENTSFDNFVKTVSKNNIGILRHQKYSYNSILEDIRSKFSNVPNLYSIMFSYQLTKAYDKSIGNYKTSWVFNNCTANDIAIHIYDINDTGEMEINYDYLTNKYSKQDIIDMHNRIIHVISQIIKNPNIHLNNLEIVTLEEKNKILYDFNNTSTEYPKNKTIIELFEEQVNRTPNNIAVVFENQKLTYRELNEKANSLAHFLRFEKNISRNEFVGIMVNRSLEMIISILAVLKSGAAYIPIDPTYPKDRIDYMLENSNAKILLTQNILNSKIDFNNIIIVDLSNSDIYNFNHTNLKHINKPDDLSYLIFTSGSTGKPKGVMLKNHNIVNFIIGMNEIFHFSANDTIASITTFSFDIFVLESLYPLSVGAKIILANENTQSSASLFNELCLDSNVNVFQTTPSRLQALLTSANLDFIKNAKYILIGGEQFPKQLLNRLQKLTNASIYNMYGPTETAVWSSYKKLDSEKNITIGKPIINTQFYILNDNLMPMPYKTPGDIYISGDGVSKGYLNNTKLTDSVFINNPFIPNSTMYKTGDIGMYLENGEIICLGRSDYQIKIRGQRIELSEIEEILNKMNYIDFSIVTKKTDTNSHEFLCAYYKSTKDVNVNDIKKHLAQTLPKYMIPSVFMKIDTIPYTPNGKIDRKKLPEPTFEQNRKELLLPRNEFDKKLVSILKKLLKKNNISLDDDFFDLGGDSLSAIALSAQIHSYFNVEILVKDIIENPIIQNLSDFISKKEKLTTKYNITSISKSNYYITSSAQKRIYYSCEKSGNNNTLYNISGGIILKGNINFEKLEQSINQLIARHESLRTYFKIQDNNVVQKVLDKILFKLDIIENIEYSKIDELFYNFVKPFDLSKAPLFRLNAVKFTNGKTAIFIDMHHIISDGMSLSIFANELSRIYNNEALEPLSFTYKDFAAYENQLINSEEYTEAENYWINQFKDEIPILNMPTNHIRPIVQEYKGKTIHAIIDKETTKKIQELSSDLCITPYMFLLSCYYILLNKYTSQEDIIIGTPVVGRNNIETYNLIGMFVNTLALRNKINANQSFKDFLINIKENMLNAYKYQTYPFNELLNKLNIHRDTSRNPLFDTMFIYQNTSYKAPSFKDLTAETYIPDTIISKFDLSLEAIPVNNQINLSFTFATSLFDTDFITQMSKHYLNIVTSVLNNLHAKIQSISIMSTDEQNKILYKFNDVASMVYPKDKTIVELFEKQVCQTPDNIAVVFENQKLTYKELNEKANSLANFLISKNIKNGDTIAIKLNRSLELIVSIFATIKTGASFVLIDPAFPQERINYIVKTSKAKYIIAKEDNSKLNNIIDLQLFNYSKYSSANIKNIKNDHLCVIYTSGSTGEPKGVILNSSGFVNLIYSFDKDMNISTYKNILGIANVTFDMFLVELFSSTLFGNTLVLANENEQKSPILISQLIKKHNVEFLVTTPSRIELLLSEECQNPLEHLKAFQLGGEKLTAQLYEKLLKYTKAKIYNGYGPTEATACCTNKLLNSSNITIGKPLPNVQIYICDANINLLPIGIIGEICIAGLGVSSGYINNKDATNKNFVKNPFGKGILYKTGDYGKYNSQGEIEYIGRIDHQIKIHGLRIELKEIEEHILKYPKINKAIVIKQSLKNRNFLTAYFTSNYNIDTSDLRNYLSHFLPLYMIPSYFIQIDAFSYTSSGKLNLKTLPLPDESRIEFETYISPKTNLEKQLVKIWENILEVKPIGINDNFFDLGGDSLLAMSLNLELLKISSDIKYSDIFQYPTILKLEEKINLHNNNLILPKVENIPEAVDMVLNNTQKKAKIHKAHPNGVLLMGATGFLGIHILEQLLLNEKEKIYCIIREDATTSPKEKLRSKLNYYFGNKYDKLLDERIIIVKGDICKPNFGLSLNDLNILSKSINVVINSAAIVAHYGIYEDFYKSNVLSIKYLIDFCKNYNKKLYHISTTSISGDGLDFSLLYTNSKKKKITLNETKLYVGQIIDNFYMRSKFEAETLLLTAIASGLDAYILRIGNLMPRLSDGKFQNNILGNAFINKIITFIKIKAIPINLMYTDLEFTPVDCASQAIYNILINSTNSNRIFHLYNHHTIKASSLIKLLKKERCLY